jgi:hypothetical protein
VVEFAPAWRPGATAKANHWRLGSIFMCGRLLLPNGIQILSCERMNQAGTVWEGPAQHIPAGWCGVFSLKTYRIDRKKGAVSLCLLLCVRDREVRPLIYERKQSNQGLIPPTLRVVDSRDADRCSVRRATADLPPASFRAPAMSAYRCGGKQERRRVTTPGPATSLITSLATVLIQ